MAQNAVSMDKDKGLRNDLVSGVQDNIKQMSDKGDWENSLPAVRSMGRNYVQRAQELAAPLAQYKDWYKSELTDDKKGLSPYQIDSLNAGRLSQYQGLKKDVTGKFVGSFNGGQVAKNIDEKKFADDAMLCKATLNLREDQKYLPIMVS